MKLTAQDKRFLRFVLLGFLIFEVLAVAFVGSKDNLAIPTMIAIAVGIMTMTLFAALLTYFMARLMDLL